ncbi:hypothetical protein P9112_008785 [Eukaryota sp. TZLM1-RC]
MSSLSPETVLSQFLPQHHFDAQFIRSWFSRLKDSDPPVAEECTEQSSFDQCHLISSLYDHFTKLLEIRLSLRHSHYKAALNSSLDALSLDMAVSSFNVTPIKQDSQISPSDKLSLLLQSHTLSQLAQSDPALAPLLLDDISNLLSNQPFLSLFTEPSSSWLHLAKLVSSFTELSTSSVNQCASLILSIINSTGSLSIALSFIAALLSVPSSLSFSSTFSTLTSFDPQPFLSTLSAHHDDASTADPDVPSFSAEQSMWQVISPVNFDLSHPISLFSSDGFVYVDDGHCISKFGTGNNVNERGWLFHQFKRESSQKARGWIGEIDGKVISYCPGHDDSLITLDCHDFNRLENDFDFECTNGVIGFTTRKNTLFCIKRVENEGNIGFFCGWTAEKGQVHSIIDWKPLSISSPDFILSNLTEERFIQCNFICNYFYLYIFLPCENNSTMIKFNIIKLKDLSLTKTGVIPSINCCYSNDDDRWFTVEQEDFNCLLCEYVLNTSDRFYSPSVLRQSIINDFVDSHQLAKGLIMEIDRLVSAYSVAQCVLVSGDSESNVQIPFVLDLGKEIFILFADFLGFLISNYEIDQNSKNFMDRCQKFGVNTDSNDFSLIKQALVKETDQFILVLLKSLQLHLVSLIRHQFDFKPFNEELTKIKDFMFKLFCLCDDHHILSLTAHLLETSIEIFFPQLRARSALLPMIFDEKLPEVARISMLKGLVDLPVSSFLFYPPTTMEISNFHLEQNNLNYNSGIHSLKQFLLNSFSLFNSRYSEFNRTANGALYKIISNLVVRVQSEVKTSPVDDGLIEFLIEFYQILLDESICFLSNIDSSKFSHDLLKQTPIFTLLPMLTDVILSLNISKLDLLNPLINQITSSINQIQSIRPLSPAIDALYLCIPRKNVNASPVLIATKIMESHDSEGNVIHPYRNDQDYTDKVSFPGAEYLTFEFDPRSSTERRYDYLVISKKPEREAQIGKYTGSSRNDYPSGPVKVTTDTLYFSWHSDGSNTDWGYKVTVKAYGAGISPLPQLNWVDDLLSSLGHLLGKLNSLMFLKGSRVAALENFTKFCELPFFLSKSSALKYLSICLAWSSKPEVRHDLFLDVPSIKKRDEFPEKSDFLLGSFPDDEVELHEAVMKFYTLDLVKLLETCSTQLKDENEGVLCEISSILSCFICNFSEKDLKYLYNSQLVPVITKIFTTLSTLSNSKPSQDSGEDTMDDEAKQQIKALEEEEVDADFLLALQLAAEDGGEQGEIALKQLQDIESKKRKKEEIIMAQKQKEQLKEVNKYDKLFVFCKFILDLLTFTPTSIKLDIPDSPPSPPEDMIVENQISNSGSESNDRNSDFDSMEEDSYRSPSDDEM